MKTIQMTIDEALLDAVDEAVEAEHTTRSAFIREALVDALRLQATRIRERRHADGYRAGPPARDEFDVADDDRDWGAL